ncbi:MAG TPA: alpha-amylase family glycosyl hydrolase [Thermomicrobiaceae bacterium]|nr:alpha-amylase family glycosyl hydrolase [Thermomicrobiaceae bacterium]
MDEPTWWQRGIVYHVYPRSFQDCNGDGVGDLPGITSRLDYLCWLGVDAIWISPIYPSPMADFGYDVTDHCAVHPMFGTLADFDDLVAEAHRRDLRVLLDYVPNHTSDRHPWFVESRASRDNPRRDWYIWRDPAPGGGPPNNWVANFGGSAWTLDERTGQNYYHAYLPDQPDLNWRNPAVRAKMLDVLRFWLDRGVDGFRVDALRQVIKDDQFRDNPPNPDYRPGMGPYQSLLPRYSTDRPEVQDVIRAMRGVLDERPGRLMIGELYLPIHRLVTYYGEGGSGVHLPANFHLLLTPWNAEAVGALVDAYERALPEFGWPNWVLSNHDRHRVASRVGEAQARVAAMLLLTLRGTPTIYYGDEIGMHDVPIPPGRVQDPWEKNVPGLGLGRDPERTPMQWSPDPGAGFTEGEPWLPLSDEYPERNVMAERAEPGSMLNLYHRLITLRRAETALAVGRYRPRGVRGDVLAYERLDGDRRFLVLLNLGHESAKWALEPDEAGEVVLSTHLGRGGDSVADAARLRPDEGLVIALA